MPVALITGANRGIGREAAWQLSADGWEVLVAARDLDSGREAAASIGDRATAIELDVADEGSVTRAAAAVTRDPGRLDVLVNNAAILYDTANRGVSVALDEARRGFETNLFGAWSCVQSFLPLLGQSPHGRIVNVSSEGGSLASMGGGTPIYSTSKAALNALTRVLAAELRPAGILVNAICPGWTATDMGGGGGRPVAEGAAGVVWAATLPDDGPAGGFFRNGRALPW